MTAYIFGKPAYVWGGIVIGILFVLTIFTGIFMGRFGIKIRTHKILAGATAAMAALHAAGGLYVWFF
ncbi:MAG: hypothetical protein CVU77_04930 [Elusimicrobia bacterium HGW-Elusimicrobia-1]|jgi:hypothetical protein|nr:MAG: hypothetical protein CVU77_04930 [Elusimicrobia bacterium HGW-Elusimicrobia-1]